MGEAPQDARLCRTYLTGVIGEPGILLTGCWLRTEEVISKTSRHAPVLSWFLTHSHPLALGDLQRGPQWTSGSQAAPLGLDAENNVLAFCRVMAGCQVTPAASVNSSQGAVPVWVEARPLCALRCHKHLLLAVTLW